LMVFGSLLRMGVLHLVGAPTYTAPIFSASALLDEESGFLFNVLSMVNPFVLWGLALFLIGTSTMTRRPVRQIAPYAGVIWLLIAYFGY